MNKERITKQKQKQKQKKNKQEEEQEQQWQTNLGTMYHPTKSGPNSDDLRKLILQIVTPISKFLKTLK